MFCMPFFHSSPLLHGMYFLSKQARLPSLLFCAETSSFISKPGPKSSNLIMGTHSGEEEFKVGVVVLCLHLLVSFKKFGLCI